MFDHNEFKRSVKDWIRDHPKGELSEFAEFCEDLIPPAQFANHRWIVDQTLSWYQHILSRREAQTQWEGSESDEGS